MVGWMVRWHGVGGMVLAMAGCLATAADDEGDAAGTSDDGGADDADDGDGGSSECSEDAECVATAQSTVEDVSGPQEIEPYVASRCQLAIVSEDPCGGMSVETEEGDPACLCFRTQDPERFEVFSNPGPPCQTWGRGDACLYTRDEFPGCDLEAPETSCETVCAEIDARRQADAAATLDAEVRTAICDSGNCESVMRVGERCYTEASLTYHASYDCALSDAEILEMSDATQWGCVGDVDPTPNDGGYCARDPEEWQGMMVSLDDQQICQETAHCGLALACVDGRCTCCTADSQCLGGEVCVLDHCVLSHLAECRSYTDCAPGVVCILSGLTPLSPHTNGDMRAYCLDLNGGGPGDDDG